jgi:signal transduction histidine kinase
MWVGLVLVASILLQLAAAILARRLIRVTGAGRAWTLITLAMLLMVVPRGITLYRLASGDLAHPPDLPAELLSLGISGLMVLGMAGIAPLFVTIPQAKDALKQARDELDRRVARRTEELAAAKRRLEENMAERKRSERELSEIAARQQQKMGQELHDGLGQQLLGLRLMAASLTKLLEGKGLPEAESARELADALMGAQGSVRALIKGIRPVEVDARGLMTGLAELADPPRSSSTSRPKPWAMPCGMPRLSTLRSAWHATIIVWSCGCEMTAAGYQAKWTRLPAWGCASCAIGRR